MKQIPHLNEQIRQEIMNIELQCERLGQKLETIFTDDFHELKEQIVIELIREVKGRPAKSEDIFNENYESYLEVGVEKKDVYFPNAYIPVWKCKREMFHSIGLLMNDNLNLLEKKLCKIITEMHEDHMKERDS
ncbi:hypothetical protein ACFFHH_07375 [Cytobacillus solani]|uniref:Uncharacterized protein n=1 Tax=Cytobacillus solani TaxID=1637975 RepID=A0A0Q3VI08_9BACI|nr:hypothetical protein [Cytobacillus solani]KOP83082.1 hypothetical protein AMS60_11730 [Bacillus sp. FJAT-21945]KQL20106.1 hypothetical protein AN957_17040 [Cytobacillus solani]USK53354.1 hypothetical protein LIS82_17295 [Cytobacillus solani]